METQFEHGEQTEPVRILLADNCPLIRRSLREIVGEIDGWVICGEAETAQEAANAAVSLRPDLTLMDHAFADSAGVQAIAQVRAAHTTGRILVLSASQESSQAELALRAGADGYISKNKPAQEIMNAVHQVLAGEIYMDSHMAAMVLLHVLKARATSLDEALRELTHREMEVFELIGQGVGTREIGRRLGLNVKTVACHKHRIKKKLALRDAGDLYRQAILWHEHHLSELTSHAKTGPS